MTNEYEYRIEESYLDDDHKIEYNNTFFSSLEAALNYMQIKIEVAMRDKKFYEIFLTHLVGDCPQLAYYDQYSIRRKI